MQRPAEGSAALAHSGVSCLLKLAQARLKLQVRLREMVAGEKTVGRWTRRGRVWKWDRKLRWVGRKGWEVVGVSVITPCSRAERLADRVARQEAGIRGRRWC